MKPAHSFQIGLSLVVFLVLSACSGDAVKGPDERAIGDSGVADTGTAVNSGLECEVDDDCEDAERCKHFGEISLCVLGCGSDDDCPSEQPTCELYGEGDGLCIRQCRTDGMCGEGEICESRDTGFGVCVPAPPTDSIGFGGNGGTGGSESAMKFQCASDANCPQGFTCEETEDGEKVCEPISNTGGSAGAGGSAGTGGSVEGGTAGDGGMQGGSAGDGGMQGGSGGSAGTGGGVEGGSAGSGASSGMGGAAGGGGDGNTGGGSGGAGGDAGNGGGSGGAAGNAGGGGMAGSGGGNGGGTGIGGADGNPLEESDTVARGYIHFAETKRGNLPAEIYGQARFASFTRFPVPVNEDDIWPDSQRVTAGEYNDGTPCFFFDGADPEIGATRRARNVGTITVSGGAQNFSLEYQEFAESYSLNPDEVFDVFNDGGGLISLSGVGSSRFGGFAVQVQSPDVLLPSDVDLGTSIAAVGHIVTWTPGNGDFVRVLLRAGSVSVECDGPDNGMLTISGGALQMLGSGNADVMVSRVVERGFLTAAPEGAVSVRLSSAVNAGNLVIED